MATISKEHHDKVVTGLQTAFEAEKATLEAKVKQLELDAAEAKGAEAVAKTVLDAVGEEFQASVATGVAKQLTEAGFAPAPAASAAPAPAAEGQTEPAKTTTTAAQAVAAPSGTTAPTGPRSKTEKLTEIGMHFEDMRSAEARAAVRKVVAGGDWK